MIKSSHLFFFYVFLHYAILHNLQQKCMIKEALHPLLKTS